MPEALYTADEMRAAEEAYPGYPDTVPELMDRAGRAVADLVLGEFPGARRITAVCGSGNNGGDGKVAARYLEAAGCDVRVVDVRPEDEAKDLGTPDLVIDAIFGTGFAGEPRPGAARLIEAMNDLGAPVVAVDVPSGVDASTGEIAGASVAAARTVTFHGGKVGLHVGPGRFRAGESAVADIGLRPTETAHALAGPSILRLVPLRGERDTKYTAGSVLVVGGSPGLTGAACLASEAAFRADAGYVTVAAPRESLPVIEARLPEAVKRPLEDVWEAVPRARSLAVGPGLGRSGGRQTLVRRLLAETDLPAVVDADGLHGLEPFEREPPTVLTPHSGELGGLLGVEPSWVDAHRLEASRRAVERFRCTVLLKGADTIVAAPGERTLVVEVGPPSLATAGSGDVLTGIVGAFLAKGLDGRRAAAAAAVAHGLAAARLPRPGLVAGDLLDSLPHVLAAA
jgi:ADP-dependent NAD(P)H-hydrate dehydratase / NAD(P)H-hydrate epimerase